jgi:uncharacterized protein
MSVYDLLKAKRFEILKVATEHGASNVRLFGSVARGEADEKSDVDILVDLEPGRTLLDHAALTLALQELMGCSMDVFTPNGLRERIRENVLHESVPL